jgi:hypothetical protein
MDPDDKLAKKVEVYQNLAKENPNINVAMLMANALSNEKLNVVSAGAKKWAYLISVCLPPLGFFIAIKYYFFDTNDDAKSVAYACVFLTTISLLVIWGTGKLFSGGTTSSSLQQIEQIKPSDIQQILQ